VGLINRTFALKFSLSLASVDPVAVNATFEEARTALIRQRRERYKKSLKVFLGFIFAAKRKLSCLFFPKTL
jgi:hypothetical protein